MEHWKGNLKREIHSITGLTLKTKQNKPAQIGNLTLHLRGLEKEQQTKPKVSRREKTRKIRAEMRGTVPSVGNVAQPLQILASRICCCGCNIHIHTDYRNPVEKKGLRGRSPS